MRKREIILHIPNNSLIVVSGLGIENYIVENNKKEDKKL